MGFFKWLGRCIGKGVEFVGEVFGSDTISCLGMDIYDACSDKISYESSYDKNQANIYTTERLNDILVSFTKEYEKKVEKIEKKCIELVEKYYDQFIDEMKNAPKKISCSAALKGLKKERNKVEEKISGTIKEHLSKRMSLDDSQCLKILKMDSGTEKKWAMDDFETKIITEALNNLSKSVRDSMSEQTENIQDFLNNIYEEDNKIAKSLKEQLDQIVKNKTQKQYDSEKNCVNSLYIIDAADSVCRILK